jgi:predicted permease
MLWIQRLWIKLQTLFRSERAGQSLNDELQFHLEQQIAENVAAGMSKEEARYAAMRLFGNHTMVAENARETWGWIWLEQAGQDLRYAFRSLRKSPLFTAVAILTLALGIGATTSIFTLFYDVLLKSLTVANPGELYRLGKEARCCYWGGYSQENEYSLVSYELYKHFRDHTQGFAELAAFQADDPLLGVQRSGGTESAQSYPGEFVSGNYFTMFGISAYAGRLLTSTDDQPGAPAVAVMSYRLWQQYGSDPSIVGAVFNIDNTPFTIVGITPPSFFGDTLRSDPPDFFLPLNSESLMPQADAGDLNQADQYWLDLIGRIRPGAESAAIEAQMRVELKQWLRSHWSEMSANDRAKFPEQTLFLRPGGSGITSMREEYEHWLQILMMVSAFVLLIVCANVANLMLVRGMQRRREISVSVALGAHASRLVRQALTESILLSLAGGLTGLVVAFAGTQLILHFVFPSARGVAGIPINASPSMPVLFFAFGVSLIAAVAFGVAPAWMATRVDPIEALRGASRSTARTGALPRKMLVVFQAALSLVLLAASGLLTTAVHRLENQRFGFLQEQRTIVRIDPGLVDYQPNQFTILYDRIRASLSTIPGVAAAAICQYSPLSGNNWASSVWLDGRPAPGPDADKVENMVYWDRVTPGYFSAIGTQIIEGRSISEEDTATSQHVAVINEAFAKKYFNNENPIGQYFGRPELGSSRNYKIVGVAQDARYLDFDFDKPVVPFFFLAEAQHDVVAKTGADSNPGSHHLHDIIVVARPGATVSAAEIRQAIISVDPRLPIESIGTLGEQVSNQFRQQRLIAQLSSFFGILSLVLASVGLYGVTAYNVGRHTTEIGVRLALGATPAQAAALIVRGALALVAVGLALGFPVALAAGKFLGSQLYGLNPYDPATTLLAILTLSFSTLVAALVPAVRASRISPSEALRAE